LYLILFGMEVLILLWFGCLYWHCVIWLFNVGILYVLVMLYKSGFGFRRCGFVMFIDIFYMLGILWVLVGILGVLCDL